MRRVLFVCTGNTCRSPMAEYILRDEAERAGLNLEVKSAGVAAVNGVAASLHAVDALKEKNIVGDHRSSCVTKELIDWADVVLTMTAHHKYILLHQFPESVRKTFILKEYVEVHPEIKQVQQALDRIFAEKETRKLNYKNKSSDEAQNAFNKGMKELQKEEEQLISRLQHLLMHHDIMDPFGGSITEYRACRSEIEDIVAKLIKKWDMENS